MKKIDRLYVSEIDKKMAQFNKTHPLSASQQEEYEKYQEIYALRDDPKAEREPQSDSLWD